MQVGLEAQGVAMPQLTENAFKDFTLLPLVTVFASIGSKIGQPMSKFFTEKFGLAKTFYAAHALRAVSLGAMVVLFGTGMMSMPLMMAFYFVNGIVTGVAATAEGTLKKLILAEKGVSQQSFRTWWQPGSPGPSPSRRRSSSAPSSTLLGHDRRSARPRPSTP